MRETSGQVGTLGDAISQRSFLERFCKVRVKQEESHLQIIVLEYDDCSWLSCENLLIVHFKDFFCLVIFLQIIKLCAFKRHDSFSSSYFHHVLPFIELKF